MKTIAVLQGIGINAVTCVDGDAHDLVQLTIITKDGTVSAWWQRKALREFVGKIDAYLNSPEGA